MGYSTGRVIVVEHEFKLTFPHLLADAPSLRTSPLARHQTERLLHQVPHHRPERFVVDELVDEFAWNVWESIVSRCPGSVLSITAAGGLEALRQIRRAFGTGSAQLVTVGGEMRKMAPDELGGPDSGGLRVRVEGWRGSR